MIIRYVRLIFCLGMFLTAATSFAQEVSKQSCVAKNLGMETMAQQSIRLENAKGESISVFVYIADDTNERSFGYQYICPEVIDKTRMLFIMNQPVDAKFHMHNVRAPLDIGFFDADGLLIDQQTMLTYGASGRPLYGPDQPFLYALETPEGFFAQQQLVPGQSRLINPPVISE